MENYSEVGEQKNLRFKESQLPRNDNYKIIKININ
jgi:hypothetical protein